MKAQLQSRTVVVGLYGTGQITSVFEWTLEIVSKIQYVKSAIWAICILFFNCWCLELEYHTHNLLLQVKISVNSSLFPEQVTSNNGSLSYYTCVEATKQSLGSPRKNSSAKA